MTQAISQSIRNAAALLEAHGHGREAIARQLEVSSATVAKLKRTPDHQALVARYAENSTDALRPLLDKVKTEVLEAVIVGINTLKDLCDAEDSNGRPLHGTRKEAAVALAAMLKELAPYLQGTQGSSGSGPATSITFNIDPGAGHVSVVAETDAPQLESGVVDGTVVEDGE